MTKIAMDTIKDETELFNNDRFSRIKKELKLVLNKRYNSFCFDSFEDAVSYSFDQILMVMRKGRKFANYEECFRYLLIVSLRYLKRESRRMDSFDGNYTFDEEYSGGGSF